MESISMYTSVRNLYERFAKGRRYWGERLSNIVRSDAIGGIEWIVTIMIHSLHIVTLSGWLKIIFDPSFERADNNEARWVRERKRRDNIIDFYVALQFLILQYVLWVPKNPGLLSFLFGSYFLFEIILNLSSIIFVGKLKNVYPPTSSIERSLLLFAINVLEVITIFAVFYRIGFGFEPFVALFYSVLVFGTVGYPPQDAIFYGRTIVAAQVVVDFALLAIFLGAFVGNLRALRRD
jgi:hypothetical protein